MDCLRSYYHDNVPVTARRMIYRVLMRREYQALSRLREQADGKYDLSGYDRLRCIFVRIPKAAGTSVSHAIFGNRGGGHIDLRTYQMLFSHAEFESYFKFAIVRNPWDRLVSAYTFLKSGGLSVEDKQWSDENLGPYEDFHSFAIEGLRRDSVRNHHLFRPQYRFLCLQGKWPKVDYVGHLETLEEDMHTIFTRLGVTAQLPRLNTSNRGDYRHYYDETTRGIVANVYRDDIDLFGYDFENSALLRSRRGKYEVHTREGRK